MAEPEPLSATSALSVLSDEHPVVLPFHGVNLSHAPGLRNYTGKHCHIDQFRKVITALAARAEPLRLSEIVDHCLGRSRATAPSFALTFDDGFLNNLTVAAPELRQMGIPATFFITRDFSLHDGMSWTDQVESAVDTARTTVVLPPLSVVFLI